MVFVEFGQETAAVFDRFLSSIEGEDIAAKTEQLDTEDHDSNADQDEKAEETAEQETPDETSS